MINAELRLLQQKAINIKKRFIAMYLQANAGHIGSSLSCAELLTFVKFACMQAQDHLILSKGHAAAALYSTLAECGQLSEADIATYYQNGTYLAAHPPANKLTGIPFATGSLGHGLSLSAGLALAIRFKNQQRRVFCITSDGELNEGSTWEAALFIAHHRLTNVVWLIDRNRLQGFGQTETVLKLEPLAEKLTAFGFETAETDGHNFEQLLAFRNKILQPTQPFALICNTIKGKDWAGREDTLESHYLPFRADDYLSLLQKIEKEEAELGKKQ